MEEKNCLGKSGKTRQSVSQTHNSHMGIRAKRSILEVSKSFLLWKSYRNLEYICFPLMKIVTQKIKYILKHSDDEKEFWKLEINNIRSAGK